MSPTLLLGSFPLVLEGEDLLIGPPGSLDTLAFSLAAEAGDWETQLADLGIVRLAQLPASFDCHSMWVQDYRLTGRTSGGIATVAINCLGLYQDSDKRKATLSLQASRVSIGSTEKQPTVVEGGASIGDLYWNDALQQWTAKSGTGETVIFGQSSPAWSIPVVRATVKETWFTTTPPETLVAGTAYQPSIDVTEPINIYASSSVASNLTLRSNHPTGWVLDSREIDPLFTDASSTARDLLTAPSGLWAVTDTIAYYFSQEPG